MHITITRRPLVAALLATILTAAGVLVTPAPAQAMDPIKVRLIYLHCHDESESFSDEPFLEKDGTGIADWQDVDGGEIHYLRPFFPDFHQDVHWFEGDFLPIELWEDDGHWSQDDFLGTFWVPAWDLNGGPQSQFVGGSGWGYTYELRYEVTSS